MTTSAPTTPQTPTGAATSDERADLLETLALHRSFLRFTVRELTDEQAVTRPTVSQLSLGGLVPPPAERPGGGARPRCMNRGRQRPPGVARLSW